MRSNPNPGWNWQAGTPPPPRPKRRGKRRANPEPEPYEPKQPFGAIELPAEGDVARDPRRLRWLKWVTPFAVAIALAGLWLTGLFLWTTFARSQAEGGNLVSAVNQYERQQAVTGHFPEPWLSRYNLGTALLMGGDLEAGVKELTAALEGVPKALRGNEDQIQPFSYECMVRMNLSAGIEMQGDAAHLDASADASSRTAVELYERALELVAPCEVPPPSSDDESADGDGFGDTPEERNEEAAEEFQQDGNEAGDRLREKLGQAPEGSPDPQDEGGGQDQEQDPQEGESGDPFEGETQEERERREELQERNREHGEQQRENEESRNRSPGSGGW